MYSIREFSETPSVRKYEVLVTCKNCGKTLAITKENFQKYLEKIVPEGKSLLIDLNYNNNCCTHPDWKYVWIKEEIEFN